MKIFGYGKEKIDKSNLGTYLFYAFLGVSFALILIGSGKGFIWVMKILIKYWIWVIVLLLVFLFFRTRAKKKRIGQDPQPIRIVE